MESFYTGYSGSRFIIGREKLHTGIPITYVIFWSRHPGFAKAKTGVSWGMSWNSYYEIVVFAKRNRHDAALNESMILRK